MEDKINDVVKNDIVAVLERVLAELSNQTISGDNLSMYSNQCIHNASIFQDQDSVRIAVVVYALYKITKKPGKIPKDLVHELSRAYEDIKSYNVESYRKRIDSVMNIISKYELIRPFISQVLEEARIKKGAKLVDHGISVAQASDVLGVSQWELQNYLGKSGLGDDVTLDENKKKVANKILFARKVFGMQ